jgi:hypothetical protein
MISSSQLNVCSCSWRGRGWYTDKFFVNHSHRQRGKTFNSQTSILKPCSKNCFSCMIKLCFLMSRIFWTSVASMGPPWDHTSPYEKSCSVWSRHLSFLPFFSKSILGSCTFSFSLFLTFRGYHSINFCFFGLVCLSRLNDASPAPHDHAKFFLEVLASDLIVSDEVSSPPLLS